MAQLRVMSGRGDKSIVWDPAKIDDDPEAAAAVLAAERIFAEAMARGATAFKVEPGKPAERIEEFDSKADQMTVIVPRIVGG